MPKKAGKDCVGGVMGEFKREQLHSGTGKKGKKGPVVRNRKQAIAIALNTCNNAESMDEQNYSCEDGKCGQCPMCKRKKAMMAMGYSESAVEQVLMEFGEREVMEMVKNRLKVMHGLLSDIEGAIAAKPGGMMEQWMIDKITMSADYLSAVADNSQHGDGLDHAEGGKKLKSSYAKGLTEGEKTTAKREAKETQEKAKSGASAKSVYEDWDSDKSYRNRQKKAGKKQPESEATKAYRAKYGDKDDTSDNAEKKAGGGVAKMLRKKSKQSGIPVGILRQVYERGMAAWRGGHRPGVPPQAWAGGRLNSFITGKGGARKADSDLWKKAKKYKK